MAPSRDGYRYLDDGMAYIYFFIMAFLYHSAIWGLPLNNSLNLDRATH